MVVPRRRGTSTLSPMLPLKPPSRRCPIQRPCLQYWEPGEILKWYIDGTLVYSVDKEALREQTNSTGAGGGSSWAAGRQEQQRWQQTA